MTVPNSSSNSSAGSGSGSSGNSRGPARRPLSSPSAMPDEQTPLLLTLAEEQSAFSDDDDDDESGGTTIAVASSDMASFTPSMVTLPDDGEGMRVAKLFTILLCMALVLVGFLVYLALKMDYRASG
ncbi:hypothetical protein FQN55_000619 [Onygenales sp. PD_40]|nr:hypothetical protein FQN55_000619 [Onygenales sp. PD_40]KAK2780587.1 hypothetical protein FQN53_001118 [Emmonsiellopsis sp. PD_33]KAK2790383.1 hypothetical protein FQN52_005651 [Onygenales sp. PD_12]